MAIFDASKPVTLTDKAGDGARVIREDLKAVFNAKLENTVITVIDGAWECVVGWPRAYCQAAPAPTPPANADSGRGWLDSTAKIYWVHDGTNWNRIGPPAIDIRIPLPFGPPRTFETAVWDDLDFMYWDGAAWNWKAWKAGEGYRFNKAQVPVGCEIRFAAIGSTVTGTGLEARLYDVAGAAAVPPSLVFLDTDAVSLESGNLTAAISAGDRRFRVQVKTTGGTCILHYAELRIVRT